MAMVGVIIDSATTFTFIAREAFEPLSDEFIRQITDYKRIKEFEDGGADVALPVEKLFRICRWWGGVFGDGERGPERVDGPGMILGSFQMQNFYVEYDLRNERLGFKQEKCK
ncbi:hypothetical protein OIU84_007949 [Salix udensis]|uniref:Xylanase inhibitor C-terminal domain-containing protein n=1 Tax=Salix udensis TaxID=889485 RepID=A0AAD6JU00_9ROSI|nr:hypothetical protein OIU84_007949 [Salix udensis]